MTPAHSSRGMISSMISGKSYRLVSILRKPYSMPVTVSCFMDAPLFDVIVHDNTHL